MKKKTSQIKTKCWLWKHKKCMNLHQSIALSSVCIRTVMLIWDQGSPFTDLCYFWPIQYLDYNAFTYNMHLVINLAVTGHIQVIPFHILLMCPQSTYTFRFLVLLVKLICGPTYCNIKKINAQHFHWLCDVTCYVTSWWHKISDR